MPKVLLVEDDDDFRDSLARYLCKVGIQAVGVESVEDAGEALHSFIPHVVILDVNLPGEDGFSALARWRQRNDVGLIMLTGRNEREDRLRGLKLGADHYLAKPVNTQELEAVIYNLYNRLTHKPASGAEWAFDAERWTLAAPNGQEARLSAAEYRLIAALVAVAGQPLSRDELFAALGRPASGEGDRSLDVLMSKLRRKFVSVTVPIQSVRNVGYVFPKPVKQLGAFCREHTEGK